MTERDPTLEDMRRIIREEMSPIWKRLEKHDREIYGHNGTKGLTTRVNSNETFANRVAWVAGSAWVALLGSLTAFLSKILGK